MTSLRVLHFMGEIQRVPTYVRLLDGLVSGSEPDLKGEKAASLRLGMIELNALEPMRQAFEGIGNPDLEAISDNLLDRHVSEAVDQEFATYRAWLLNSALVLVVAFLDSFLDEVVRIVLQNDPTRLLSAARDRQMELKQVLEAPSREAILAAEIERVARKVAFMSFKDRLAFVEKRLGIPITKILTWRDFTEEGRTLLESWDIDRLDEVHERRHQIAHRGTATPLTSIEELRVIAEVFTRFVLAIGLNARRLFGIPFDVESKLARMRRMAEGPDRGPPPNPR